MAEPKWLVGDRQRRWWRNPWTIPRSNLRARKLKKKLWNHGYLSPNFRRAEARSGDGVPVSERLRKPAQKHAVKLERVRHRLGDRSMNPLSWYRSPAHNAAVGGATSSQHLYARATDWSDAERLRLGSSNFNAAMHREFRGGGIGVICGTSNVRHVDSRGYPARWCY